MYSYQVNIYPVTSYEDLESVIRALLWEGEIENQNNQNSKSGRIWALITDTKSSYELTG